MTPDAPTPSPPTAPRERLDGARLEPARLAEVIAAYEPILAEIARLRELDLADVHPAIVFEPTAAYRAAR